MTSKKLEKIKKDLYQEIVDFLALIAQKTFPHDIQPDFSGLAKPEEIIIRRIMYLRHENIEITDEEINKLENQFRNDYEQVRKTLNLKADAICNKYDSLITTANRIL